MLINLSNHPVSTWSQKQLDSAIRKYKQIADLPFPKISPYSNKSQITKKALFYLDQCQQLFKYSVDKNNAVHLMGEYSFVCTLYEMLKKKKITVVVSTTDRIVKEKNKKKIVVFNFVKFREC